MSDLRTYPFWTKVILLPSPRSWSPAGRAATV